MSYVPLIGRLDVTLASLLAVERHRTLRDRRPSGHEVAGDVLSVVDHLALPPEALEDLDHFQEVVDAALGRLVDAAWIGRTTEDGIDRFRARRMAETALAWICTRLGRDGRLLQEFEMLDLLLTKRVLGEYGDEPIVPDAAHLG